MHAGAIPGCVPRSHPAEFPARPCDVAMDYFPPSLDNRRRGYSMDAKTKRKTLRLLSNGVYILTSRCGDQLGAATVTWVSQASFQPPLLMAALRKESNVYRCLAASRIAALHIVGNHQKSIAQKFFSPTRGAQGELNGEPFSDGATSAPILENFPDHLECKVIDIREDPGDHAIVLFEVVEASFQAEIDPLTVADSPWEYGG